MNTSNIYGIDVDNKIFGFVKTEDDAIYFIEQLANNVEKILAEEKPYRSFYQQRNNNHIDIYTLKRGVVVDSRLVRVYSIKYYPVKQLINDDSSDESSHKDIESKDTEYKDLDTSSDTLSDDDVYVEKKKRTFPVLYPASEEKFLRYLT